MRLRIRKARPCWRYDPAHGINWNLFNLPIALPRTFYQYIYDVCSTVSDPLELN